MGNQWGDIYLCVPPTKMLGGGTCTPVPPIIAAPGTVVDFSSFRVLRTNLKAVYIPTAASRLVSGLFIVGGRGYDTSRLRHAKVRSPAADYANVPALRGKTALQRVCVIPPRRRRPTDRPTARVVGI